MRTMSFLKIASLALVLAAPLASIANAGDHSGDQWRSDDDNRHVVTAYAEPNPALVQLEARVYQTDVARLAGLRASFQPIDTMAKAYIKPANPDLVQLEAKTYQDDVARLAGMSASFNPIDTTAKAYIKPASPDLVQMEERAYRADLARRGGLTASVEPTDRTSHN